MIEIVKQGQPHVPCISLGHLDVYGVDVLDTMLGGNYSIMEIVEFFANYKPMPGVVFNKKRFMAENPPPEEEETEEEEEEERKRRKRKRRKRKKRRRRRRKLLRRNMYLSKTKSQNQNQKRRKRKKKRKKN